MGAMSDRDYAFEMAGANLRFGWGATREVGEDLARLGAKRVLLVTDPVVKDLAPVLLAREAIKRNNLEHDVFDRVRVEPNDKSFQTAIEVAQQGRYDAFVAVGGGSSIDTAKAANLYSTWPADLLAYVPAPIGEGRPAPGPLKPLIAIPTTAGSGSETTSVATFDLAEARCKTAIVSRYLRPTLGIVDPENTRTQPPGVAAAAGLDVLCHALESYTAMPYDQRPKPDRAGQRPAYQGANPISDVWAERAMMLVARYLVRAYQDPADKAARANMALAASYAGMGFGLAGVHLCHAMSCPVSSLVRRYHAPGYPGHHPLVPHGLSVALTAPAVFRFTAQSNPRRHLRAARFLGAQTRGARSDQAGHLLVQQLIALMRQLDVPNGLWSLGFTRQDVTTLAKATLVQERVTQLSPRAASELDLAQLFEESMSIWPA